MDFTWKKDMSLQLMNLLLLVHRTSYIKYNENYYTKTFVIKYKTHKSGPYMEAYWLRVSILRLYYLHNSEKNTSSVNCICYIMSTASASRAVGLPVRTCCSLVRRTSSALACSLCNIVEANIYSFHPPAHIYFDVVKLDIMII